jgi:hypothetical protein
MGEDRFVEPHDLTQTDIDWFRSCRSLWVASEAGAPAIFGTGLSPDVIATVSEEIYEAFEARMEPVLCAFFLHATFLPGRYAISGADGPGTADVTEEDLALFQRTSWRGFTIDAKRPYGDYTNYPVEMARILGLPVVTDAEGRDRIDPDLAPRLEVLHRRSMPVLQAYIEHAELAPGRWLIPFEGWEAIISPRCRPVGEAAMARYKAEMVAIAARETDRSLIPERMVASIALFRSP